MRNYKSLEAYNFFISGWVHTVLSYKPEKSPFMLFRADVVPSQRVNDTPHHPWVALSSDGAVAAAHCDCMTGLCESCSHIGAILYNIERAVGNGYTKVACTDESCKWNVDYVKKVQPDTIKNTKSYSEEYVCKTNKPKAPVLAKATEEEQQALLKSLFACKSKPVVLSTFNNFSKNSHWEKKVAKDPTVPPCLRSLYDPINEDLDCNSLDKKCSDVFNRIHLTDMEQYSRRNCLKFRGIPETEGESTDQLVVNTCNVSLGVMVTEADISRSHRVGPMNKNYPRDIIVRFLSYRTRANVYSARFSLFSAQSDQPSESTSPPKHKIYINEALTKARSAVFNKARFLKNQGHVSGAWTQDGRIVIRNSNGEKHQVTRLEELPSYPDPPPKKPPGPRTLAVGRGTQRTPNAR